MSLSLLLGESHIALLLLLQILQLIVHRLDGSNCHFLWILRLFEKSLMPFKQTAILVVKLLKVRFGFAGE
jgi:hypothetical protein